MSRLAHLGERLLEEAGGVLLLLLVVVTLLQVASRYVVAVSLPWTEEAGRFLFTWLIWIGAAVALRRLQHMRFEILVQALRGWTQAWLRLLVDALVLAFLAVVVVQGWRVAESVARTAYIAIPWLSVKYAYGVTVVAGSIMLLTQLEALVRDVRALHRGG